MLQRRTPIKRKTRIRRVNPERAKERREYAERKAAYLAEHFLDQIKIAFCGFDEADVLARAVHLPAYAGGIYYQGQLIRRSDQIHHRLKCYGQRLLDERWWMATALESHDYVENHKSWAREEGYLLPIQADAEGRWGSGNQGLTTPELMKAKQR